MGYVIPHVFARIVHCSLKFAKVFTGSVYNQDLLDGTLAKLLNF